MAVKEQSTLSLLEECAIVVGGLSWKGIPLCVDQGSARNNYCMLMYMSVQAVCLFVCLLVQSFKKIDDQILSTVRWFLHRSDIAAGL